MSLAAEIADGARLESDVWAASLRADSSPGDGDAWVDAARALGGDPPEDAVRRALAAHSARVAP